MHSKSHIRRVTEYTQYPQWLEENKATLSQQEYENYNAQYLLYKQANILLAGNKPDTSKIMDILLKVLIY